MALQTKRFTGNYTSGTGVKYTYSLLVAENSTNGNSSNITVKAILSDDYGITFKTWGTGVSCTLNGSEIFNDYKQRNYKGPGDNVLYTWTGDVDYPADRKLKVSGQLWQNDPANWSPKKIEIKESDSDFMTLTAVSSTAGAADAYIGSNTTISVKRNSTSYSHVIKVQFGNITRYIQNDWSLGDSSVKLTDTSISFKIPESFYDQIHDAPSGVCKLTVTTYNGDTQVGSDTESTFKCLADPEQCSPSIEGNVVDVNPDTTQYTRDASKIVRFMSTAQCTPDAVAKYGASIVEKKVNGMAVTGDYLDIPNVENDTFVFFVTDSRGFTATKTVKCSMIPYVKLTCEASCKRVSPTSDKAVLNVSGDWFGGDFIGVPNELEIDYTVRYVNASDDDEIIAEDNGIKPTGNGNGKYSKTFEFVGLEYQKSYKVTVTVSDLLSSETKTFIVGKGIPVFDWGENDFRFNVPVYIGEKTLEQYIKDIMNGG